jgi:hypothetical protein
LSLRAEHWWNNANNDLWSSNICFELFEFFLMRGGTIKPCFNTITQYWTYARFVKQ